MKQLILRDQLAQGLRVFEHSVRNSGRMVELVNSVTMPIGLVPWKEFISAELEPAPSFPFPQLAQLHGDWYFFGESVIWFNGGDLVDVDFPPGGQWDIAELENSIVACNGECIVVVKGPLEAYTIEQPCNSLCSYKGQLVLGGVNGLMSWGLGEYFPPLTERHVVWLPILGPGLELVTNPDSYIEWWNAEVGAEDSLPDILKDVFERNELGFKELDSEVLCVRAVNHGVVAFTRTSVWALMPISGENPGFGWRKILDSGAGERGCAGGPSSGLVFVDESGRNWVVSGDLVVQPLYYDGLITGEVVVSHRGRDSAIYIADPTKTLVFSSGGLSEVREVITAVSNVSGPNGHPTGYSYGMTDESFYLKTDVIDFGEDGVKTLHSIRLEYDAEYRMDVRVHYRDDSSGLFRPLPWVKVDSLGAGDFPISTSAIILELRNESYKNLRLHEIRILFEVGGKLNSKRAFRRIL